MCPIEISEASEANFFFADLERSHVDLAQVLIEISQKKPLSLELDKNRIFYENLQKS